VNFQTLAVRDSFLSLLPRDTEILIEQCYLKILMANPCVSPSLTGTIDSFTLISGFQFDLRLYAVQPILEHISRTPHANSIVHAARCSDAQITRFDARKELAKLKAQNGLALHELQLQLALTRLIQQQQARSRSFHLPGANTQTNPRSNL